MTISRSEVYSDSYFNFDSSPSITEVVDQETFLGFIDQKSEDAKSKIVFNSFIKTFKASSLMGLALSKKDVEIYDIKILKVKIPKKKTIILVDRIRRILIIRSSSFAVKKENLPEGWSIERYQEKRRNLLKITCLKINKFLSHDSPSQSKEEEKVFEPLTRTPSYPSTSFEESENSSEES